MLLSENADSSTGDSYETETFVTFNHSLVPANVPITNIVWKQLNSYLTILEPLRNCMFSLCSPLNAEHEKDTVNV